MSRNWTLALVAGAIWVGTYAWYFIGVGKLRATASRWVRKLDPRRDTDRKSG